MIFLETYDFSIKFFYKCKKIFATNTRNVYKTYVNKWYNNKRIYKKKKKNYEKLRLKRIYV